MSPVNPPDAAQPLRILHLVSSQRWTGAAEPAALLAREQLLLGHDVHFACIGGSSFERKLAELELPFVPGFFFNRRLNPREFLADLRRLRRLVDQRAFDIVHCHLPHDHWLASFALRAPGSRRDARTAVIRTIHREGKPYRDLAHRWLVGKGADRVIVVSRSQRRRMEEEVGLPPSRIALVPGAVDLERFHPDVSGHKIRRIYKIPKDARVAGMVARMRPHRGHHQLIDVVEDVARRVPRAVFTVAGRGELKAELIERIRNHDLRTHLRRIGYRKNDLPQMYAAHDVIVLLRPGSDGTCRAMLEAMACGRPVIGGAVGAIEDTIEPGKTGWLVPPGNRHALVEALVDALAHPDKTREMGAAARRWVEAHATRRRQAVQTLQVYREALARRPAASLTRAAAV